MQFQGTERPRKGLVRYAFAISTVVVCLGFIACAETGPSEVLRLEGPPLSNLSAPEQRQEWRVPKGVGKTALFVVEGGRVTIDGQRVEMSSEMIDQWRRVAVDFALSQPRRIAVRQWRERRGQPAIEALDFSSVLPLARRGASRAQIEQEVRSIIRIARTAGRQSVAGQEVVSALPCEYRGGRTKGVASTLRRNVHRNLRAAGGRTPHSVARPTFASLVASPTRSRFSDNPCLDVMDEWEEHAYMAAVWAEISIEHLSDLNSCRSWARELGEPSSTFCAEEQANYDQTYGWFEQELGHEMYWRDQVDICIAEN